MATNKKAVKSKPALTTDLKPFNRGLDNIVQSELNGRKVYDEFAGVIVTTCNSVGAKVADYFDYNSQTKDKAKLSPIHAFIDARRIDTKDRMMLPVDKGGAGYKDNLSANTIWSRDVWPRVLALVSPAKAAKIAKEKAVKAEQRKKIKPAKVKPGASGKAVQVSAKNVAGMSTASWKSILSAMITAANKLDAPDFKVNEFVQGCNVAIKAIDKKVIGKKAK